MPGTTTKGAPHSLGSDAASTIDNSMMSLAQWVDERPGIASLTTVQRDALSGATRWVGRVIWNSTTSRLEAWNGTAWENIPKGAQVPLGLLLESAVSGGVTFAGNTDHVLINESVAVRVGALHRFAAHIPKVGVAATSSSPLSLNGQIQVKVNTSIISGDSAIPANSLKGSMIHVERFWTPDVSPFPVKLIARGESADTYTAGAGGGLITLTVEEVRAP